MNTLETIEILKALGDKSRLLILNALFERPHYAEELAKRLDISAPTISFHMKKLEKANLVQSVREQYYTTYRVKDDLMNKTLRELLTFDHLERNTESARIEQYRQKVLRSFMRYGKITQLPVQLKKRLILYQEIMKAFEMGKKYSEREVNIIIADFNDDFCTIRREMVDYGMMDRKDGIYWLLEKQD